MKMTAPGLSAAALNLKFANVMGSILILGETFGGQHPEPFPAHGKGPKRNRKIFSLDFNDHWGQGLSFLVGPRSTTIQAIPIPKGRIKLIILNVSLIFLPALSLVQVVVGVVVVVVVVVVVGVVVVLHRAIAPVWKHRIRVPNI